jgi:hypothetical protein
MILHPLAAGDCFRLFSWSSLIHRSDPGCPFVYFVFVTIFFPYHRFRRDYNANVQHVRSHNNSMKM